MAVEGINIDLVKVANIAEKLSSLNTEIHTTIQNIETEVKNIQSSWDSPAQRTLATKYSKLGTIKDNFYSDLTEYANYLRNTVKEYGYTEKQINNNANEFM